jgi:signal transduction histidine kinase
MAPLNQNPRPLARASALLFGLAGFSVVMGWQFRIGLLKGDLLGTFIAPNTGLLFVVCSVAVLLHTFDSRSARRIGTVLGFLVFAAGLATLLEYLFQLELGIDGLFMSHRLSDWYIAGTPGRFSVTTAVSFTFAGLSLATSQARFRFPVSDVLAGMVALVSYLGLVGYFFNVALLFGRITALPTILMFAALSAGLWCSAANPVFFNLITSEIAGGIVARRFTTAILVLLPILGLLEIRGREQGLFGPELGIALLVSVSVSVICALALHTAFLLNEVDRRRLQAEAVLVRTEKLAAAGRMAATIAHEINNPLSAVTNLLYLSRGANVDAATRDSFLSSAEEELKRVASIAKQTLGFYRETVAPGLVDPAKLISSVIDLYQSRLVNRGIVVTKDIRSKGAMFISSGEMRQVLSNILANAVDACPAENGKVNVRVWDRDDRLCIEVSDNGAGVPPEDRTKIFEPFFSTKKDVGTGLGLWVSRQLVEKNGGEIWLAERNQSPGATFVLVFPLAPAVKDEAVPVGAVHVETSDAGDLKRVGEKA